MDLLDTSGDGRAARRSPSAKRAVEARRLAAVRRYARVSTPADGTLDRVAALAARIFRVPTATVTIVEEDRVRCTAAFGWPEAGRPDRGTRLCAAAILQADPYVVTDAASDPRTRNDPLVRGGLGLRFYAGAPITTADGFRLGTVNVIDRCPRRVTDEELAILRDLAQVVMDNLEVRLSAVRAISLERYVTTGIEQERSDLAALAETLQRSLLPPTPPRLPHCEVAVHHQPAHGMIGGDFYDLFPSDEEGRRWGLFIGDVAGKGVRAACHTSLSRYTLRTEAITRPNPARMLASLDAAIALDQAAQPDLGGLWFCTAIAAIVRPGPDRVVITLASGGHPGALVLRRHRGVEVIDPTGPIIGCLPDASYGNAHLELTPGDTLVLHTDGLTDARRGGIRYGEDRLQRFLAERTGLRAAAVVEELRELLTTFDQPITDDVAILALSLPS